MKKIARNAEVEIEVRGSKFIGMVSLCESEEQAKQMIHSIRKTHPKANHHCSAYILSQSQIERSNDDGEPSSTAGLPILQVLRGNGLTDVCAVVVRYFGGTLLGRGGLIKAYTEATVKAITAAGIREYRQVSTYSISFPYQMISSVENLLQKNTQIIDRTYNEQAVIVCKSENLDSVRDDLINACKGQITITHISTYWE